jgi:MFS family permease
VIRDYIRFVRANPRFLAFGFALACFSSFGQTFFVGLFGEHVRAEFDLTHGAYGLVYSVATLTSGFCMIGAGRLIDHADLRLYSSIVGGGLVLACLLVAAAPSPLLLVVAFFTLRLSGQGLMSHTAMTSMARYFDADRGKAMSVAGLGFPAGEAVLPIAGVTVIAAIGWRQTWLAIAVLLAIVLVPLTLWLLSGHAARHADFVARTSAPDGPAGGDATAARRRQWTRGEVVRDPRFALVLPAILAPGFIATGVFFHQPHLVATKGWTASWFAACFVGFAAAQLPASLLAGPVVDRVGATRLLPFYLVPMGVALLALGLADHPLVALLFLVMTGLTAGVAGPIVGALWAELYGVRHLGAIRALATAAMVLATAGSPVSMGWLIDAGVSIDLIALICLGYVVVASALVVVAMRLGRGALAP